MRRKYSIDNIEKINKMSPEKIRAYQEKKLRNFIRTQVYPFHGYYREVFDRLKISPKDINTIKDLEKLPLTKKNDIMPTDEDPERYKKFILQPNANLIRKYWPISKKLGLLFRKLFGEDINDSLKEEYSPQLVIATSGTTGNNVPFIYTSYDLELMGKSFVDVGRLGGIRNEHRVLNMFPFAPHLAFTFVYIGGIKGRWFSYHTGGGSVTSTKRALELMEKLEINILIGIPSYLYHFIRTGKENNADFSKIEGVFAAGERFPMGSRKKILDMLVNGGAKDPKVIDVYGTTEMRTAFPECSSFTNEFHTLPHLFITEIVDPKTGKQKKPGESGSLAITCIDGRGSIVLRYLIGDVIENGVVYDKCPHCGSNVPRLKGPIGRIKDYEGELDLANIKGTLVNMNLFYDIIPNINGIEEWQVVIGKKNNDPFDIDEVTLRVYVSPKEDVNSIEEEIREKIHNAMEITPRIEHHSTAEAVFEKLGGNIKADRIIDSREKR